MNRSSENQPESTTSHFANWLALGCMCVGLSLLLAQQFLAKPSPDKAEEGWSESERIEFRELYQQLHAPPTRAKPDEQKKASTQLHARMKALDTIRLERQAELAARQRLLRMIALGLLGCGIAIYFGLQAANN